MPRKKYLINLSDEERQVLAELTRKGEIKARKFKRAMMLLKADEGFSAPKSCPLSTLADQVWNAYANALWKVGWNVP